MMKQDAPPRSAPPGTATPLDPVLVHAHVILLPDGREEVARFVSCPSRNKTVSLRDCASCGRSRGVVHDARLDREVVDCDLAPVEETSIVPEHSWNRAGDPLGAAVVAAAMSRDVICARPEAPLQAVWRTMEEEGAAVVVVVDEGHRMLGVVTGPGPGDLGEGLTAGDRMRGRPPGIAPTVLLTRAAAVMAFEGLDHLVVIDEGGKLAGVLSARDVLRYLGQAGGALIPPATGLRRGATDG